MQNFQKDKSLGLDGWGVELFLGVYEVLGSDILTVAEEYRREGSMLLYFNMTFIVLIPKKDALNSFEEFMPLSLCNEIYKVIAKIIANRLKPILSTSIKEEQFGFLEERQIHEVVGATQEGLHSLKI